MSGLQTFDAVVVGGGPAGATAACDLARRGRTVLLLDRAGRIKPCGGAIPPRLISEFAIPDALLVARVSAARVIAPSARAVHMPIGEGGFVGMVDRESFDEWLRERAAAAGALRRSGTFERLSHDAAGGPIVHYRVRSGSLKGTAMRVRARVVIGADGAKSAVARQSVPGAERTPFVFAYHEIVRSPPDGHAGFAGSRCDVYYQGAISPDFYGWRRARRGIAPADLLGNLLSGVFLLLALRAALAAAWWGWIALCLAAALAAHLADLWRRWPPTASR